MEQLKRYIGRMVNEALLNEAKMPSMEQLDSGQGMNTVYRVAFKEQVESIFKYGYDRVYTNSKGGNMYGPAVYCTFRLKDSRENVKHGVYGNCIMAMRLIGGLNGFLIFNENIARSVYGNNWRIEDQLMNITKMPRQKCQQIVRKITRSNLYHGRTAPSAHEMWETYGNRIYQKWGIRGLVYYGLNDGLCCIPYDFKAVVPYSVSYDGGYNFRKELTPELYQFIKDHSDVEFQFAGKYDRVFQSVRGYTLVKNKNKFNFINNQTEEPISPFWFEEVTGKINPNNGRFGFVYGGYEFIGSIESPDESVDGCVLDPYFQPFCPFRDLKELAYEIKRSGAKDFEEFFDMQNDDDFDDDEEVREAIRRMVNSVIQEARTVNDDGVVTIDNFDDVERLLDSQGPDDVWFVQIIKRHKDNMNQYFARNACEYIAYYLIHDADELESKRDEIMSVCRATNSRAYIHLNKRSLCQLTDYANHVLKPRFERYKNKYMKGHEMEIAAGQPKDWPDRKLCFLDVDSDDPNVYKKVMTLLNNAGITPVWEYRSLNNGWHILLPDKDEARHVDFKSIDNGNDFGRFATVGLEIDRPILLYASLKPNGYKLQQNVQKHKMSSRHGHGHGRRSHRRNNND